MKEDYGFFNSKDHDRVYNAKDWADYFFPLFKTGVFNGDLQVVENEGMSIKVKPGYAWIDGYKYHLWDEGIWDLEIASGNMNRKDSIVVRLDHTKKWVRMFCKTGSYYAGTAIPPAPEISATIHEIVIAHISVPAGTTRITQSMIEDTRMDKTICGWVCGAVEQIDFSQITAQFNAFFADYREDISEEFLQFQKNASDYSDQFVTWVAGKKAEITTWQGAEEEDFDKWVQEFVNKWESWLLGETKGWQEEIIDWFNNLREQLTENAAVSLQEQIGNLNDLETENKDNIVSAVNSLALTYDETMAILAGVGTIEFESIEVLNGGESAIGKKVTLRNETTGREVTKEYTGGRLSFDVFCGMEHSVHVEGLEEYITDFETGNVVKEAGMVLVILLAYRLRTLEQSSWEQIVRISEEGRAGSRFKLHDTKEIKLTTGEKIEVEIVGFDHDILTVDESKTAGITFGMKDCLKQTYRMNATSTNVGGWKESEMRKVHVRERFYNVLPKELKDGIKQVNKNTSTGNKSTTVETTADDVWLFSLSEMGSTGLSTPYSQEGSAYPAFNSDASRIKHKGKGGSTATYWLRSAYAGNTSYFETVDYSGTADVERRGTASVTYSMAAGFCV